MTMTVAMTVMMKAMMVVVSVEPIASDMEDLNAHVDDRGILVLLLGCSVQCTI